MKEIKAEIEEVKVEIKGKYLIDLWVLLNLHIVLCILILGILEFSKLIDIFEVFVEKMGTFGVFLKILVFKRDNSWFTTNFWQNFKITSGLCQNI